MIDADRHGGFCMSGKIGILFDLDGTLLDTLEDLTDAVNYTMRHFACPELSKEQVRMYIGNGPLNLMEKSLSGASNGPSASEALQVYKPYYETHSEVKTRPYTGISEMLQSIMGSYPVAVVSNKQDAAVKSLCQKFFPGVYAQGETNSCPRKPAPDMLYMAMQAIGVERCIFVGDSEVDVLTANHAGMPCVSVLWGFRNEEILREYGAKYFCDEPLKLPKLLEEIVNG